MIRIYESEYQLSQAAARLFVQIAAEAIAEKGCFQVLLSGGQTPRRLYELLAASPLREEIAWDKVQIFWGDERYVPADDEQSNQRMVRQSLLDHVAIPLEHIHPIPFAATPQSAAQEYEKTLKNLFAGNIPSFDLILLGIGSDGHTASLFPATAALNEQDHWVTAVQHPQDGSWRITLTFPVLNQAGIVAFVVAGAAKAAVLQRILEGSELPGLPAQQIRPLSGNLYWLMDQAAAKLLTL